MPKFFEGEEIVGREIKQKGSFSNEKVWLRGHASSGNQMAQHIMGLTGPETVLTQTHVFPSATFMVVSK